MVESPMFGSPVALLTAVAPDEPVALDCFVFVFVAEEAAALVAVDAGLLFVFEEPEAVVSVGSPVADIVCDYPINRFRDSGKATQRLMLKES